MTSTSDQRAGFALPAVLTVTGVVTLIFVVAITALASLTSEAAASRARIRFLERGLTVEATVAFLAATEPFTARAIAIGSPRNYDDQLDSGTSAYASGTDPAELLLDGTTYSADLRGPMQIVLRDQAGMINLPQMNASQIADLGERLGIERTSLEELRPRLSDYTDTNDLELPDGAERDAYGRQRIANRPLLTAGEFRSVLGLRTAIDPTQWRALRDDLAADQTQSTYNINTASPTALKVLFGLSPEQADRALEARVTAPFFSVSALGAATGAPLVDDGETFYTFPSGRVVFTLSDGQSAWTYRGRLNITPSHPEQPVWIDQLTITESPRRAVANTTNATAFPYTIR
jgi:hypothetical protein